MDHETILDRKLRSLFPDRHRRDEARAILDTYGIENHEQEPVRVRLAVLKLSGSDLEELKRTIDFAKQDFRDVLSWAEYLRQSKKWDGSFDFYSKRPINRFSLFTALGKTAPMLS